MLDQLVDRAVQEVWAAPDIDRQFLIEPVALSDKNGDIGKVYLPYEQIILPDNSERFMVYQVGQWAPDRLGIDDRLWNWVKLSDLSNDDGLLVQFMINHKLLPLHEGYIRRTKNRALIFAFPLRVAEEDIKAVYSPMVRVYTNHWYSTPEGTADPRPSYMGSTYSQLTGDPAFFTHWAGIKTNPGSFLYKNGILVNDLTPSEIVTGDKLSLYEDHSVEGYFDIALDDLLFYTSDVDSKNRYIIQVPEELTSNLHYIDDLEVYIMGHIEQNGITRDAGIYVPRITKGTIKMLTHCDFALEVNYVTNAINQNDHLIDFANTRIRVYYRKNNKLRPDVANSSFLRQFYQLPKTTRLLLMTGTNSNVAVWQAKNLEQGAFTTFMSMTPLELTNALQIPAAGINDVYNYFGLMEIFETSTISNGKIQWCRADKENGCLIKSFDADGNMIDYRFVDDIYTSMERDIFPGTTYIETIPGKQTSTAEINGYDETNDFVGKYNEVRYLLKESGEVKAVLDNDFTVNSITGKVTWDGKNAGIPKRLIRSTDIIMSEYTLAATDVTESLPLLGPETPLTFTPGIPGVEVYIDGKRANLGLDYILEYPNFRIFKQITHDNPIDVKVILHGIPLVDDKIYPAPKTGWILDGEISRNNVFEFYKDTYSEIYIDGRYVSQDQIKLAETGLGSMPNWVTNGMPYAIYPRVQHIPTDFVDSVTAGRFWAYETLDNAAGAVDNILTQGADQIPSVIIGQYELVSPLLKKVIDEIRNGSIQIDSNLSDAAVGVKITPYSNLVEIDPASVRTDIEYLDFVPHSETTPISVTLLEYNFLERVNAIYLNNNCTLSSYILIGS